MKKVILSALLGLSVVACSGIKKDYNITAASYLPEPKWVKKEKYKASKKDEFKYFVSKAENVNQRLCEKTANSRANLVVASEIAMTIEDAYKNAIKSTDGEASELSSEQLKQTVKLNLAGVQNEETYWQKRQYLVSLGASEDIIKYQCYSLVKMTKENYNRAVNASVDKIMKDITMENKEQITESIKEKVSQDEN